VIRLAPFRPRGSFAAVVRDGVLYMRAGAPARPPRIGA
jgi:hypothetical protein